MPFDLKQHLKTLCAIHAPSGHEAPVRDAIRAAWSDLVHEFDTDGLGSLIATAYGKGPAPPTVLMDEITDFLASSPAPQAMMGCCVNTHTTLDIPHPVALGCLASDTRKR